MRFKDLIPILNVSDIERSLAFYRDVLYFELVSPPEAVWEWRWAPIRSGSTVLMLSETENGPGLRVPLNPHEDTHWPSIFHFYPDDVETLYDHVTTCGCSVSPLETTFYGNKEFSMQDPDGQVLSFGQEVQSNGG